VEGKLQELKQRLIEVDDLQSSAALLHWDQSTYMPPGGAPARARQSATLQRIAHEKFTDPEIGRLLDELEPYAADLPYDSDEAGLIRATRRDYERAVKVPSPFMAKLSSHMAESYEAWAKARPADDFSAVRPHLEQTLHLSRQLADYFPGYEHIADPLIDFSDDGMTVSTIRPLFDQLRDGLVPLVEAIADQSPANGSVLRQHFPEDKQLAFGYEVAQRFGFDTDRGRLDKTHHPFATKFSIGDVRITTRVKENNLGEALFSTLHEAGHGMYEQGVNPEYEGTPLADGTSAGVHESQSRLWENVVGRSRRFWHHFYPQLQDVFPDQLSSVQLDTFYQAVNTVERSLIRTDADEVTYNLHVLLRFGLELDLLEGRLEVGDLPDAWHEAYDAMLGVTAPDDRDGVLQDVHWFAGTIGGAFQGYTLGNVLGAQFYAAALDAHPEIPEEIERGEFGTLHTWLKTNIYHHGSKYTPGELIERVAGGPLRIEPYLRYLRQKYGELYDLD
jgi:carboxypeptidase Taq